MFYNVGVKSFSRRKKEVIMLGFSLYLNEDKDEIIKKLEDFKNYNYLFTSMHYPLDDKNIENYFGF